MRLKAPLPLKKEFRYQPNIWSKKDILRFFSAGHLKLMINSNLILILGKVREQFPYFLKQDKSKMMPKYYPKKSESARARPARPQTALVSGRGGSRNSVRGNAFSAQAPQDHDSMIAVKEIKDYVPKVPRSRPSSARVGNGEKRFKLNKFKILKEMLKNEQDATNSLNHEVQEMSQKVDRGTQLIKTLIF